MSKFKKRLVPVKYTSRDFESIQADLIDHAKRYYPDTFKDFGEASFGSLMVDSVAYIGDILSFYLDYQANESFIDTSNEYSNIIRHGHALGYKYRGRADVFGEVSLYASVPASALGMGPDTDYIPVLGRGTTFSSRSGGSFTLIEDVRFDKPTNNVVVAKVNERTGLPTHYAIKSSGVVVSGRFQRESFEVGSFQRFRQLRIGGPNVTEIIEVYDSNGNRYFEVDYLSQDVIYRELVNKDVANDSTPSILKPFTAPRRFTVYRNRAATILQFGYGADTELKEGSIVDPANIVLDVFGKDYVSDRSFDPSKLMTTDKFGIGPSNTTVTVVYRVAPASLASSTTGDINQVRQPITFFPKLKILSGLKTSNVINSLEVYNEEPIVDSVVNPNKEEIKRRIKDTFAAQNRAVTKEDYEAFALSMPQKFGALSRVNIIRDPDSTKRNLNMYVLGQDDRGFFITAGNILKRNLKVWLSRHKMLTDTIDILDAKVVNIGIQYSLTVRPGAAKADILNAAAAALTKRYTNKFFIAEPLYINEITNMLDGISGVLSVKNVKIIKKTGALYSNVTFNIDNNISPDGSYVMVPKNVVLEVKYPAIDFVGTIV